MRAGMNAYTDLSSATPAPGALAAARRAHEHVVVLDHEITALDEGDPHLAREERVLEEGGVVDPGREDHRHRVLAGTRRRVQQRVQQQVGIVLDRPHRVIAEELGEDAIEQVAILEHVGHAARTATVILEHEVLATVVSDDVGADHVSVDPARRQDVQQLALVLLAREDQRGRDDVVLEALLAGVDVGDEEVEGGDALDESGLELLPFARGEDARNEIEGKDALDAFLLTVDGEGDALVHERELLQPLAPVDLLVRERLQHAHERAVVRARRAVLVERLVKSLGIRHPFHGRSIASGGRRGSPAVHHCGY
jgi:hypothetical protein